MAHFNFVINQNAKWGHAGFYIDRHRMTSSKYAYWKVLFYNKSIRQIHQSLKTDQMHILYAVIHCVELNLANHRL